MAVADIRTPESHIGFQLPRNNICWCFGVFSWVGRVRVCHWLCGWKEQLLLWTNNIFSCYDRTSVSIPSLSLFLVFDSHSPGLIFLPASFSVCVCVRECEFVCWGVTQRGESPELKLTMKCCVFLESEREKVLCSRRAASSPHSIAHAEPSVWNALLSKFEMTWGDVLVPSYRGVSSFESSSVPNDKPRSSDGREQSKPPRPPATDYLPCFGASICHRARVRVSSSFSCVIKATSW